MSKTLGPAYEYLKKFGARRSLAALLMYASRSLSKEIDVDEADKVTRGSRLRLVDETLGNYDFTDRDLRENKEVVESWRNSAKKDITCANWFVPDFREAYAGIMNIFRFADYLGRKGIRNSFIINGKSAGTEEIIETQLAKRFPALRGTRTLRNPDLNSIPYADVSFATFWATAYSLLKFNNTLGKFYFLQDNEALFYEAGAWSALAELTYHFGFQAVATTPTLKDWYLKTYDTDAVAINPCVDTTLYYPDVNKPREKLRKIFFFARPLMPRNGFDLGILALKRIKSFHPEIEVVVAGSNERWAGQKEIKRAGFLSLEETAALYRSCDAALYLMFSLHPGVIPFELMASGCTVVTNDSPAHRSVLRNGYNCILCVPTVTGITESFEQLTDNYPLRNNIFGNGLRTVGEHFWDKEMDKAYKFLTGEKD